MYRKTISGLLLIFISSCGVVKKKTTYGQQREITIEASTDTVPGEEKIIVPVTPPVMAPIPEKAEKVINTALTFSGTRYKYGGTTKKGMDCSGLLYVAFLEHKVSLPRVSYQMANEGSRISLDQVTKGDLLFFKTGKKSKKINHVGLVVAIEGDEIKFIHATSSRGVIVSSLREGYWNYAFVKATRVL
jgi:cell wall-associated NlpC family hydrolase